MAIDRHDTTVTIGFFVGKTSENFARAAKAARQSSDNPIHDTEPFDDTKSTNSAA